MRPLSVHNAESRIEMCLIYYKPPLDVCPVHTWINRPHERRELILHPTRKCRLICEHELRPQPVDMRIWNMGLWSS